MRSKIFREVVEDDSAEENGRYYATEPISIWFQKSSSSEMTLTPSFLSASVVIPLPSTTLPEKVPSKIFPQPHEGFSV